MLPSFSGATMSRTAAEIPKAIGSTLLPLNWASEPRFFLTESTTFSISTLASDGSTLTLMTYEPILVTRALETAVAALVPAGEFSALLAPPDDNLVAVGTGELHRLLSGGYGPVARSAER